MANELQPITSWTFLEETSIPADVQELLIDTEYAKGAFKTFRDVAIFTNKRLIVKDAQGLTGSKVEIYTLPYSSIVMYSSENSGKLFDLSAEIELWTKAGHIKIQLGKKIDVRQFDKNIAESILQDK